MLAPSLIFNEHLGSDSAVLLDVGLAQWPLAVGITSILLDHAKQGHHIVSVTYDQIKRRTILPLQRNALPCVERLMLRLVFNVTTIRYAR